MLNITPAMAGATTVQTVDAYARRPLSDRSPVSARAPSRVMAPGLALSVSEMAAALAAAAGSSRLPAWPVARGARRGFADATRTAYAASRHQASIQPSIGIVHVDAVQAGTHNSIQMTRVSTRLSRVEWVRIRRGNRNRSRTDRPDPLQAADPTKGPRPSLCEAADCQRHKRSSTSSGEGMAPMQWPGTTDVLEGLAGVPSGTGLDGQALASTLSCRAGTTRSCSSRSHRRTWSSRSRCAEAARPGWSALPGPSRERSRGASGAASCSCGARSSRASGRGDVRARTRWRPESRPHRHR